MAAVTYNPASVSVIVGGKVISGFADGTGVSAMRNNPMWALEVGMQGYATRTKSSDYSGKIVLTLQQSSEVNDYLQSLATADEQSESGVVPIFIRDASGTTVVSALTAWIEQLPQVDFGKEQSNREWTFVTDNINIQHGGNFA